uniref:Protein C15F1.2 n=2 Tax=Haemonchus contortus TaxID=6289 RepID=A0A7I4Y7I0_HAECO
MLKLYLLCSVSVVLVSNQHLQNSYQQPVSSQQQVSPERFCERYVECVAVSTLEERLCLGNTELRPFWLPNLNDQTDCHEKLRNDYITLERMEEKLDQELLSCLLQNTAPFSAEAANTCNRDAYRSAATFDFARSIFHVPTQCFTSVERRIARQCGQVKSCCSAVSRCSHITTSSPMATAIKETRTRLRQRAQQCSQGMPIDKLPLPQCTIPTGSSQRRQVPEETITINYDVTYQNGVRGNGYDSMNDQFSAAQSDGQPETSPS